MQRGEDDRLDNNQIVVSIRRPIGRSDRNTVGELGRCWRPANLISAAEPSIPAVEEWCESQKGTGSNGLLDVLRLG